MEKTQQQLIHEIEHIRKFLIDLGEDYPLHSHIVVSCSQKLDLLLNEFERTKE
ncbi:aspartyl-phosphate phosphatase Spo0E family protein [Halalkalibacterium halodurans]|jgi:stage 0 sporulation regulatory protein|uniref:Uncharacterized protein BH0262 n=1 Tax=Halalkalibacterium halodurans (strain ATCC BAA-125 / DSM 18197 / FERM 7344 / JCM 9153 / C-125) TaxID=272558 RepID=Y262_HALH5|nr:aspartyl-phosphate phosphatase Spo0E family protein [Halalkalibacterium halodurans]Q9KG51.1 RecName: Full=Uncharacterized protein BH0262 [Halalkalibacterium halodurans C-125]MDY7220775.1 aspartyl-phosphate phosphatase Spo0E family protein [Halalkalibacterium halodurans]MDY7240014.1 aspartyl-phosphate phosphatase Spo0E family protein [Halalkalibacterium halodurans]MED3647099.1 aspartyl-phosphate phosphatase Spo0E family protein [Halalkalibacterium halodurans]MED4082434.1 aspartyl-phosphate p